MARVFVLGSYADSLLKFRGELLKQMVVLGHDVYACAPCATDELVGELTKMGVRYQNIFLDRTGLNPVRDIRSIFGLVRVFNAVQPDVVLSYTIKPVLYGSFAARIAGVKSIFSIISGLGFSFSDEGFKSRIVGKIVHLFYKKSLDFNQRIFFQNPDDLNLFYERGLLKSKKQGVLINGSGVDVNYFQKSSFPPSTSFLLIARLLKAKGIYEYTEAAKRIKHLYPKVKFRLVGWIDPNPDAIEIDNLQSWQDSGTIEYLGQLSDVRPAIADSSIYALPSYREGTPRTVLEAMSMGRPIITTDVPGCRETVVDGENGFLVPVKDVDSLVEAMEKFILEPSLIQEMGKVSRKIAEEKYDVRKVNSVILSAMGLNANNTTIN